MKWRKIKKNPKRVERGERGKNTKRGGRREKNLRSNFNCDFLINLFEKSTA